MVHYIMAVFRAQNIPHLKPPVARFMSKADPRLQFCSVGVDEWRAPYIFREIASVALVAFNLFTRLKHISHMHLENHIVIKLARREAAIPPNNIPRADANPNLVPKAHPLEFVRPEVVIVGHGDLVVRSVCRR